MKKAIACLLVLPLALAACGAQTTQPAPTTAPEMTTEATTENGKSTPAEVNQPGITGRMRPCSTEVETAAGLYTLHELFNEAANEDVYCVVKTDIETATQEKVASITLDGGYYGMAVWDDAVDLYLQENTAEGERPSLTRPPVAWKSSRWMARLPQPGTMTLPFTRKTAQTFGSKALPGWTAPPVK